MILSRLATYTKLNNDGHFHLLISISYIIVLYYINIYIFINRVTKKEKNHEKKLYIVIIIIIYKSTYICLQIIYVN